MKFYSAMLAIRQYELTNLPFMETMLDRDILMTIGYEQEAGGGVPLKCLNLLPTGSLATINRRISRLVRLGVIHKKQSESDKRVHFACLCDPTQTALDKYADFLPAAFNRRNTPGRESRGLQLVVK